MNSGLFFMPNCHKNIMHQIAMHQISNCASNFHAPNLLCLKFTTCAPNFMHQISVHQISYASNLLCLRFLFVHQISENMHQISNCASNLPCLKSPMHQISNCASNLCASNLPCTKLHAPNWIHQIGFTKFSCTKSDSPNFPAPNRIERDQLSTKSPIFKEPLIRNK